jgi:hypothetical protein
MTPGIRRFVKHTLILATAMAAVLVAILGMDERPDRRTRRRAESVKFSHRST